MTSIRSAISSEPRCLFPHQLLTIQPQSHQLVTRLPSTFLLSKPISYFFPFLPSPGFLHVSSCPLTPSCTPSRPPAGALSSLNIGRSGRRTSASDGTCRASVPS